MVKELAGGELLDPAAVDGAVEGVVEVFQGFLIAEVGLFQAALELTLAAHMEFVLEEEFEELQVVELVTAGFLEALLKGGVQAAEAHSSARMESGSGVF